MINNMMMDNMMVMMCILMAIGLIIICNNYWSYCLRVVRLLMKKSRTEDRPLMILKELYAKGEISDEEYMRKRQLIDELK